MLVLEEMLKTVQETQTVVDEVLASYMRESASVEVDEADTREEKAPTARPGAHFVATKTLPPPVDAIDLPAGGATPPVPYGRRTIASFSSIRSPSSSPSLSATAATAATTSTTFTSSSSSSSFSSPSSSLLSRFHSNIAHVQQADSRLLSPEDKDKVVALVHAVCSLHDSFVHAMGLVTAAVDGSLKSKKEVSELRKSIGQMSSFASKERLRITEYNEERLRNPHLQALQKHRTTIARMNFTA